MNLIIDTNTWERSSYENWSSPTSDSLKMLQNLNHDYIVSDVEFANYTLSSDISPKDGDDDGIGVVFDYLDSSNYKYIMYQGGGLSGGWGGNFGTNAAGRTNAIALFDVVNGVHNRVQQDENTAYWNINSTFNIKLENLFDDVFFYVNDVEVMRYKKKNAVSGKIGFVTFSQVTDFNNIRISKALTNRAKAKFKLYAVKEEDKLTEVSAYRREKNDALVEITPIVRGMDNIPTEIFSIFAGHSSKLVEIQPVIQNIVETEIEVRPHNRMFARYEVQQPPIIEDIFNPTQDSFTREQSEYQSINYGSNNTIVVGNTESDIWRSFVQFDVSSLNPSYILTESMLRLYYRDAAPVNLNLEILNADQSWQEYSITNLNKPNPIKLITGDFTVNEAGRYIEFNVFDIVKDWLALATVNNGFIIRTSVETELGQAYFGSRESATPPELVTRYYDSRIFSSGRSQHVTEIFVIKRDSNDVWTEIEPSSVFSFSEVDTEIYAHLSDVPLDDEKNTEITISMPDTEVTITPAWRDSSDVWTEIGVITDNQNSVDTVIAISRDFALAEISAAYRNEIDNNVEISVSRPDVLSEISARVLDKNDIMVEIEAKKDLINKIETEITARLNDNSEILIEIEPNRDVSRDLDVEITVSKENVKTEISARVASYQEVYTVIYASRSKVETEVEVKNRSDILVEIESLLSSKKEAEITVTKPEIHSEITVFGYSAADVQTEIYAIAVNQVEAEVEVKYKNDMDTEIDPVPASYKDAEISPSRKIVPVEVVVPYRDVNGILVDIEPRVLRVSNVDTVIIVGSKAASYAFII